MSALWRKVGLSLCGWLALNAQAQTRVLPESAFVMPQPCRVDPYGDADPAQRELQLDRSCGLDRLQMRVDGPRVQSQAAAVTMAAPKFEVDQLLSRNDGFLTHSLRLGWSAAFDDGSGKLQTDHALLAAGTMLRLNEDWAVDMNVGRDVGGKLPLRTTFSGLRRPIDDGMLFAQLAPETAGLAGTVGLRWWVLPKRLVFNVAAHRSADGQTIEPRVGFSLFER